MYGSGTEDGIIDMAIEQLFYSVENKPDRKFLMQVTFLEIYNESIIIYIISMTQDARFRS